MKILIMAEKFGYGPIITAINIVENLACFKNEINFLGTGIALEQAKLSKYFNNYYECRTYLKEEISKYKKLILSHDIIISCENQPGAIYALSIKHKNVCFIDNLMWMWDKIDDNLSKVNKYFISEIIPSKRNYEIIGKKIKKPYFVGPLRKIYIENKEKKYPKEKKLIINFGGAEAFIIDKEIVINFYYKIINQILESKNIENLFNKIIICGGSGVINKLKIEKNNSKITIKTLSNQDYLREIKSASHLILSSGLGNFIETIGLRSNILYLPPINYSQYLQLKIYEELKLGLKIINWNKFNFYKEIPSLLDENKGVNLVLKNVENFIESKHSIKKYIEKFIKEKQDKHYINRIEYIEKFNKNGNKKVASIILEEENK